VPFYPINGHPSPYITDTRPCHLKGHKAIDGLITKRWPYNEKKKAMTL